MRSQAVLVAIGINWEGRRNILTVELASRESLSSWKELLADLRQRSLHGVEFVVSDDHAVLRRAIQETTAGSGLATLYVCFLRNALDYLQREADDDDRVHRSAARSISYAQRHGNHSSCARDNPALPAAIGVEGEDSN